MENNQTTTFEAAKAFNADMGAELVTSTRADRTETRYVVCMGDHIETRDKFALQDVGAKLGGVKIGLSETEGCPTLRRTSGMILRGAIAPMETVVLAKRADQRSADGNESYIAGTNSRGYTVYPGDDIGFLLSDNFKSFGIVEITALRGKGWDTQMALAVQKHFFPEWAKWLGDDEECPKLLSDWEDFVKRGQQLAPTAVIAMIGDEMLESARLFRQYALDYIEKNRQAILSKRASDTGGFYVSWSNRARLYANQLGIVLEDENKIAENNVSNNGSTNEVLVELMKDRELRMAELELQKQQIALLQNAITPKEKVEQPVVKETEPVIAETVEEKIEDAE